MTNTLTIPSSDTPQDNISLVVEEKVNLRVVRGSGLEEVSEPSEAESDMQGAVIKDAPESSFKLPEFIIPCFKPRKYDTW
ncbi:MAG TPA: hypothetical protein VIK74_04115 [Parasegetibacter sp.]|jgi:hypothetical protein